MHPNPRRIVPVVILLAAAAGGVWWWISGRAAVASELGASGTIETVEVDVAPELGGQVSAVFAQEG